MSRRFHGQHLIHLRPRDHTIYIAQNHSVLSTNKEGFIDSDTDHGLFVYQTRLLSKYRYFINGEKPYPLTLSNVRQHSWLGYYILYPPGRSGLKLVTKENAPQASKETLELRISRYIGDGIHEDVDIKNFTDITSTFRLSLMVDADFADALETSASRQQFGTVRSAWQQEHKKAHLNFQYEADHEYRNQDEVGKATFRCGVTIEIENADTDPNYENGAIQFQVTLDPFASWHTCVHVIPEFEGKRMPCLYRCRSFAPVENQYDNSRETFLAGSTRFEFSGGTYALAESVRKTLERAKHDLAALRLYDHDRPGGGWIMAAGLPVYVALYGRDVLAASWQAGMLGAEMMIGALDNLAKLQGTTVNDWRDEQPGRMIHEARTGPLARLNYIPHGRYYGSATTSGFFPFVISELWHWTGNQDLVRPMIEPAMKALQWLEEYSDLDRDGFYEYQSRSINGVRNQGWKDSDDGILYEDGQLVPTPIATCEEQAFVYVAKLHLSEVLWWLDQKDLAKRLYHEAGQLKSRFNERFWMEKEGFIAMGMDPKKRLIRSIGSNAGHCLACGIVDDSLVEQVADRLMRPDLYSGWGIRTLSNQHRRFNPYSYHRGSVWPVEQGTFGVGFVRYGFHSLNERLARGVFEAAELFDFFRLPELFSGHQRDEDHPFPAFYPDACSPQAWSASSVLCLLQAILGLYPYAPLNMLLVDPHLPEWLPEIILSQLKVGEAVCKIRFYRDENGKSKFDVLNVQGKLHVIRQPSPWSLTASFAERLKDILQSYI